MSAECEVWMPWTLAEGEFFAGLLRTTAIALLDQVTENRDASQAYWQLTGRRCGSRDKVPMAMALMAVRGKLRAIPKATASAGLQAVPLPAPAAGLQAVEIRAPATLTRPLADAAAAAACPLGARSVYAVQPLAQTVQRMHAAALRSCAPVPAGTPPVASEITVTREAGAPTLNHLHAAAAVGASTQAVEDVFIARRMNPSVQEGDKVRVRRMHQIIDDSLVERTACSFLYCKQRANLARSSHPE
jgi:hypothetical protein